MPDVAGLPRSTYYYYTRKQKDPDKYAELKEEICSIVTEHKGRYGYRRVTQELQNRGFHHNHKLVMKLMKKLGLTSKVRMKKYHSYKGEVGKIAPNLLDRDFYAEQSDQKWVTDVTEFSLFGEKLYLSPILDLCSEDLISCTISEHPMLSMVTSMLEKAFDTIPDGTGLILHSVPFPVSWTVKMKKKQKETQDILSYHTQAAGCSDKARAKASGGRQPIEECGRTGL